MEGCRKSCELCEHCEQMLEKFERAKTIRIFALKNYKGVPKVWE